MPLKPACVASDPNNVTVEFLAIGVFAGASATSGALAPLDRALRGGLGKLLKRNELTGKKDQAVEIESLGQLPAARIGVYGLGDKAALAMSDVRALGARAARDANGAKARSLAVCVPDAPPSPELVRAAAEGMALGAYRFTKYLTGERRPKTTIKKATVVLAPGTSLGAPIRAAARLGGRVAECVCLARDLVNEPPNELPPPALAAFAETVAKDFGLECEVFDKSEIEKRGMKLVLAVGQGSAHEPRVVHLAYKPRKPASKRLVVVGKGLTFDSGGLCIKPAQGMGDMKSDMAGAANVIALMAAVSVLQPELEVHGVVGAAENMPDGAAYRPGDIFGSLDGKSVEIVNTDAEGRLVLADALAFARSLDPTVLLCNATLTGACVVALGQRCSGFYATSDELGAELAKAAKAAGEQFWRMPFLDDLKDQLKSDVADLKHVGDRWGGSVTAALFLREFVGDTPFIHCDIAGPALAEKPYSFYTKGGTGHGVLTFLELVDAMQKG
jgi:leucyl aminopeptidase